MTGRGSSPSRIARRAAAAAAVAALLGVVFVVAPGVVPAGVPARVSAAGYDPEPTLEIGARTYQERCVLCHGDDGMGDGLIALAIDSYPPTNLLKPRFGTDHQALRDAVVWGGSRGPMTEFSPPWGDELTWTEIESVSLFVAHLRDDTEAARGMLSAAARDLEPTQKLGRQIFRTRCALCHGDSGEGDGKMARVVKDPPPFDLTLSRAPDEYLKLIIGGGGTSVGRSPQMPPWRGELSQAQIDSVVLYIKTLRR